MRSDDSVALGIISPFPHLLGSRSPPVHLWRQEFSSRWYLCARKSPYALQPVSQKFPQRCLWNGFNVCLTDDGPLSSFQGRSSSSSSFNASLLQAISDVMSLALCPHWSSVSSFSTLKIFRKASHLWEMLVRETTHLSNGNRHLSLTCVTWQQNNGTGSGYKKTR